MPESRLSERQRVHSRKIIRPRRDRYRSNAIAANLDQSSRQRRQIHQKRQGRAACRSRRNCDRRSDRYGSCGHGNWHSPRSGPWAIHRLPSSQFRNINIIRGNRPGPRSKPPARPVAQRRYRRRKRARPRISLHCSTSGRAPGGGRSVNVESDDDFGPVNNDGQFL